MSERIPLRFDRDLKPEWIDFSLAAYIQNPDEVAHREALRTYLGDQIAGQEALLKTITQLQRTAGPRSVVGKARLESFYAQMSALPPDERAALRLLLLEESIPFFCDTIQAMRRMKLLGMTAISTQQLYDHMMRQYGDRKNLRRCLRYILQTLSHMQLVQRGEGVWATRALM